MENLKLSHGSLFLLPSDTTYLSGLASQTWGLLTSAHFCSLHSSINPALLLGYLLSLRHVTSCCHPHFLTLFCSAWKVRFNPSPLSELGPPSVIPSQPLGHTAGSGQGPQVPYLLTVQAWHRAGLGKWVSRSWGHLFRVWSTLPELNLWLC